MDDLSRLAQNLRDAMRAAHLNAQQLAARLRAAKSPVHTSTISRIRNGNLKGLPDAETLVRLASACETTVDRLLRGVRSAKVVHRTNSSDKTSTEEPESVQLVEVASAASETLGGGSPMVQAVFPSLDLFTDDQLQKHRAHIDLELELRRRLHDVSHGKGSG